jgi:hypothetical protein
MSEHTCFRVILKPCPWCDKTPELLMPMGGQGGEMEDSWLWEVACQRKGCHFNPRGKHIVIRKKQRLSLETIKEKLNTLCSKWNFGCTLPPYEALDIPLDPLLKVINKYREKEDERKKDRISGKRKEYT